MKPILCFLLFAAASQAGVVKTVTFPVRHPLKTANAVVTIPIHPVRTVKAIWRFVV